MKLRRHYRKRILFVAVLIALFCIYVSAAELNVSGQAVGMKVKLRGLLVTSVESGSAAENAGLRSGDCLLSLGGVPLNSVGQLTERVESGNVLVLSVLRNGESRTFFIQPNRDEDGYKLGAAVRDDLAGIGTVTYYDPATQSFGALGHGICNLNGSMLLSIQGGVIVPSSIVNVDKSISGTAGQLLGEFDTDTTIGSIEANTPFGVFGKITRSDSKTLQTATSDEIQIGAATVLANVSGTLVREYRAEIVSKLPNAAHSGKDLLIRITDPDLLSVTGGIVQGMSGSPIIQNGKLIGAITHVLINSPEYGYAIYIDRMLEAEKGRLSRPFIRFFDKIRQTHY